MPAPATAEVSRRLCQRDGVGIEESVVTTVGSVSKPVPPGRFHDRGFGDELVDLAGTRRRRKGVKGL